MIVVDTNVISYLLLPTQYAEPVEQLFDLSIEKIAPYLWRSEFLNVLAKYLHAELISMDKALSIHFEARSTMAGQEYAVDGRTVLNLLQHSGCSAYDCEFIALAQHFGAKLITYDKKILRAFPDLATTCEAYLGETYTSNQ